MADLFDRRIKDAAKENLLRNRRDGDGHHHEKNQRPDVLLLGGFFGDECNQFLRLGMIPEGLNQQVGQQGKHHGDQDQSESCRQAQQQAAAGVVAVETEGVGQSDRRLVNTAVGLEPYGNSHENGHGKRRDIGRHLRDRAVLEQACNGCSRREGQHQAAAKPEQRLGVPWFV